MIVGALGGTVPNLLIGAAPAGNAGAVASKPKTMVKSVKVAPTGTKVATKAEAISASPTQAADMNAISPAQEDEAEDCAMMSRAGKRRLSFDPNI